MRFTLPLIVIIAAIAVWAQRDHWRPAPESNSPPAPFSSKETLFEGLHYNAYRGESTKLSFYAEEVVRRNRKWGNFSFGLFKELHLKNARLRVELPLDDLFDSPETKRSREGPSDDAIPATLVFVLLDATDFGVDRRISRAVVEGCEIEIVGEDGSIFELQTGELSVGKKSNIIELADGIAIRSAKGQQLNARSARWNRDNSELQVRGAYEWRVADAMQPGRDARFLLERSGNLRLIK